MSLPDEIDGSYGEEIHLALKKLKRAIVEVLNNRKEIDALVPTLQEWEKIRQKINDQENIGMLVGVGQWKINLFLLTGDIESDVGQINFSKLKPEE